MIRLLPIIAAATISIGFVAPLHAELFGNYVGYKACVDCHSDKVDGWKTTPHAHAFKSLKEQGKEKQQVPGCVKCHVVGMDEDGGFIDMELTPELKDVQCESCHGPGLAHTQSEGPDEDAPDGIIGRPGADVCRKCHTPGQDNNFNYTLKSRFVHGKE